MTRYSPIALDSALVLITGAARGIGLATARAFHDTGAHVAIGDLDGALSTEAAASVGPRASGHPLDVADRTSYAAFLAAAEEAHGRPVDVLVNNAGIMPSAPFLEQRDDVDRTTWEINVLGPTIGMRLVLPGMIERGRGHVVNVCSLVGRYPLQGLAGYNASKFAALGLTQSVRREVRDTGVSVSAILPSAVKTELASGIDFGLVPQVEPEDVARAVVRSVRHRRGETAVPRYVGAAARAGMVTPESVMAPIRSLLHDDAPIAHVDASVRAGYLDRIGGAQ